MSSEHPEPDAQRDTIKTLMEQPLMKSPGTTVFVLSAKWFELWKEYVNYEDSDDHDPSALDTPGEIDNTPLCENEEQSRETPAGEFIPIHKTSREGVDHVFVSEKVWKLLHGWYGGGPALPREVIAYGETVVLQVELHPYRLQTSLLEFAGMSETKEFVCSKLMNVADALTAIAELHMVYEGPAKLYRVDEDGSPEGHYECLDIRQGVEPDSEDSDDDIYMSLEDLSVFSDTKLVLEVPNMMGVWPREAGVERADPGANAVQGSSDLPPREGPHNSDSKFKNPATTAGAATRTYGASGAGAAYAPVVGGKTAKGRVGLRNLGNTCFMNSTLQCLSNTEMLTGYFLSGEWENELNTVNPLGMKGDLATAYAAWISEMWLGPARVVTPAHLKRCIGKFCPTFAGFQQHDSQELLNFLLDGLHEDLNRVIDKPLTDYVESDGTQPDQEVADLAWERHLERNRSIVIDLLYGQLKSTVNCPTCARTSITFDPCAVLSVPMPAAAEETGVALTFVPADGSIPVKYRVSVPPNANVAALKAATAEAIGRADVTAANVLLADVYVNRMYSVLDDKRLASYIRTRDVIYAYESVAAEPKSKVLSIINRVYNSRTRTFARTGWPFVVRYTEETTVGEIKAKIHTLAQRLWRGDEPEEGAEAAAEDGADAPADGAEFPYDIMVVDRDAYRPGVVFKAEDEELMKDTGVGRAPIGYLALNWKSEEEGGYRPDVSKKVAYDASAAPREVVEISLEDCLERFKEAEQLTEGNEWFCSACGDFKLATKQLEPWRLPDNLVIHLKRFQRQGRFGFVGKKLTDPVRYPLVLDMDQYLPEGARSSEVDNTYDLYAVSLHSGSLHFGHYTAHALNQGEWYNYNDSSCRPVDVERVLADGAAAYVLFYKRRNPVHVMDVPAAMAASEESEDEGDNNDADIV